MCTTRPSHEEVGPAQRYRFHHGQGDAGVCSREGSLCTLVPQQLLGMRSWWRRARGSAPCALGSACCLRCRASSGGDKNAACSRLAWGLPTTVGTEGGRRWLAACPGLCVSLLVRLLLLLPLLHLHLLLLTVLHCRLAHLTCSLALPPLRCSAAVGACRVRRKRRCRLCFLPEPSVQQMLQVNQVLRQAQDGLQTRSRPQAGRVSAWAGLHRERGLCTLSPRLPGSLLTSRSCLRWSSTATSCSSRGKVGAEWNIGLARATIAPAWQLLDE